MIIKCTKCKKEFEQKNSERRCGCRTPMSSARRKQYARVDSPHAEYMSKIRRYFQNPIYQHYRLYHDEDLRVAMCHGDNDYFDPYPEN